MDLRRNLYAANPFGDSADKVFVAEGGAMIWGIDPASTSGWAVFDTQPQILLDSGIWVVGDGPLGMALGMREMLGELHQRFGVPRHVGYEHIDFATGVHAAQLYGGLRAALLLWCCDLDIGAVPVPVAAGKKALTGNGRCDKADSMAAVLAQFRTVCVTHDQADAIGIALGTMEILRNGH